MYDYFTLHQNTSVKKELITFYLNLQNNLPNKDAQKEQTYYQDKGQLMFTDYCTYIFNIGNDNEKQYLPDVVQQNFDPSKGKITNEVLEKITKSKTKTKNSERRCSVLTAAQIAENKKKQKEADEKALQIQQFTKPPLLTQDRQLNLNTKL
jgi:hypothetical protein